MKVAALIQARMGSTRLPGKVLMEIAGKPMILHIINRLESSKLINKVIVATTINKKDDVLEEFCRIHKIDFYRGSEDNIADRLYQASLICQSDISVRVWGDCPLTDPFLIDRGIIHFINEKADYLSNFFPVRSYPHGFEFEMYSISTLKDIILNAKDDFFREFPFEFVRENSNNFKIASLENEEDISDFAGFTVDYPQDAEVISKILGYFAEKGSVFGFRDIVKYCEENKAVIDRNKGLQRNIEYKEKLQERMQERR